MLSCRKGRRGIWTDDKMFVNIEYMLGPWSYGALLTQPLSFNFQENPLFYFSVCFGSSPLNIHNGRNPHTCKYCKHSVKSNTQIHFWTCFMLTILSFGAHIQNLLSCPIVYGLTIGKFYFQDTTLCYKPSHLYTTLYPLIFVLPFHLSPGFSHITFSFGQKKQVLEGFWKSNSICHSINSTSTLVMSIVF